MSLADSIVTLESLMLWVQWGAREGQGFAGRHPAVRITEPEDGVHIPHARYWQPLPCL